MAHRTDPARPGTPVLPDGRLLQEVTSYARRGSRLNPTQQSAWDRYADRWLVPPAVATTGFEPARWFGREAPLVVEIGSGNGEAVSALAAAHPAYDVLAVEVWRPGVASTFARLAAAEVTNVRVLPLDAVWFLEHLVRPGQLAGLWTFFPDPWHKKRHHKRRLVSRPFAAVAAARLARGASWRLATDWDDYAAQMVDVLDGEPTVSGGVTPRWEARPVTKFERRGVAAGRRITDLRYVRD